MRYRTWAVLVLSVLAACAPSGDNPSGFTLAAHPADSIEGSLGTDLLVEPGSGDVLAAWVAPVRGRVAVMFSRSRDGGLTWTAPVAVTTASDSVYTQEESVPVLAASAAGIAIAYGHVVPTRGTPWSLADVRITTSTDGGVTWRAGTTVNSDSAGPQAGHQFQGVTTVADRGLVAAWLDTRTDPAPSTGPGAAEHGHGSGGHSGTAKLYWVRSDDFGATWSANHQAGERLCDCCRVTLGASADGRPLATWRQAFPRSRRETVVATLDTVLQPPRPVHVDDWEFDGCPDAGPESAVDARGFVHVVWFTGAPGRHGIWYARSRTTSVADGFAPPIAIDTGAKAPISRVAIAVHQDGAAAVVYDRRPDFSTGLFHAEINPAGVVSRRTLREGSIRRPEIVATRDGAMVLSWTEAVGGESFVRYGTLR